MEKITKPSMDDHDLLIRLDTKVDGLAAEIKTLRDDTLTRIANLEVTRVERDQFESFKKQLAHEIAKEHERARTDLNNIKAELVKTTDDFEKRFRNIERFMYIAIGVSAIIQIIGVPIILKLVL